MSELRQVLRLCAEPDAIHVRHTSVLLGCARVLQGHARLSPALAKAMSDGMPACIGNKVIEGPLVDNADSENDGVDIWRRILARVRE